MLWSDLDLPDPKSLIEREKKVGSTLSRVESISILYFSLEGRILPGGKLSVRKLDAAATDRKRKET